MLNFLVSWVYIHTYMYIYTLKTLKRESMDSFIIAEVLIAINHFSFFGMCKGNFGGKLDGFTFSFILLSAL